MGEEAKKIEDILKYKQNNWEIYQKLLSTRYIPFIGAGLSVGIGVGDWNTMLYSLQKSIFRDKYGIDSLTDTLESEKNKLNDDEKAIVEEYLKKLEKIDEEDRRDNNIKEHIAERIKIIKQFKDVCTDRSENLVLVYYVFFVRLVESTRAYSSYEAGELLELIANSDERMRRCLTAVINEKRPETGWKAGQDKAIYWLPKIMEYANVCSETIKEGKKICNCITVNFDNILEDTCKNPFIQVRVTHFHGDIALEEDDICLTLSGLIKKYDDDLNMTPDYPEQSAVRKTINGGVVYYPYLFLGTSFSEGHIGRLTKSISYGTESIAIVPMEDMVSEIDKADIMERYAIKTKPFGIRDNRLFYYPTVSGDHMALVSLLHQLARDVQQGIWNNAKVAECFFQKAGTVEISAQAAIESAVQWFGEMEAGTLRVLRIEYGSDTDFSSERGVFSYHTEEILYGFAETLLSTFERPDWSVCWKGIFSPSTEMDDDEPLGNTLYIVLALDEPGADEQGFMERICQWIKEKNPYEYLKCGVALFHLQKSKQSIYENIEQFSTKHINDSDRREFVKRFYESEKFKLIVANEMLRLYSEIVSELKAKTELSNINRGNENLDQLNSKDERIKRSIVDADEMGYKNSMDQGVVEVNDQENINLRIRKKDKKE